MKTRDTAPQHWLVRATTIRKLWYGFSIVLVAVVLLQAVLPIKGYFSVDSWFGFGAVYGFASCLLMVLLAKLLGIFLKRPQTFYDSADVDSQTNMTVEKVKETSDVD